MTNKKIYFFESWNGSPHLETSFEIAKKHLDDGDEIFYYFCGHDLDHKEYITFSPYHKCIKFKLTSLPECKGAKLIQSKNFHFYPRINLEPVDWNDSDTPWTIESLRSFKHQDYEAGLSALSSLVHSLKSSNPDLNAYNHQIHLMLNSGIQFYEFVKGILSQNKADIVYVFNGRFSNSRAVMNAAQHCNIPYLIHERGSSNSKYSVRNFIPHDRIQRQAEMLQSWEQSEQTDKAKNLATQYFQDRRLGIAKNWKSHILKQNKGTLPPFNKKKRLISYFSSSDDEFVAVGDCYKWEYWQNQLDAVNSLIQICKKYPDSELVIRIHPHIAEKSTYDQQVWTDIDKGGNTLIIPPESEIDTYALIEASDVVITSGSTVGIESVFWGTPSITLGPSMYSELHATYQPKGPAELEELLFNKKLSCNSEKSLPYGYYFATFGIDYKFYEPTGLLSGKFLGVDLQEPSAIYKLYLTLKSFVKRFI